MKKAALVLSGGGGLGLAHVGALRILEKKYDFEYYAGVSAGAIISAAHALGINASEVSTVIHDLNFFKLAFDFTWRNFGILRGKKVYETLVEVFGDKDFADLPAGKTLKIYATDFSTGERVEITSGSIAKAVMASLSVPLLFEPLWHQDRWLVDGGLSGNFPVEETLSQYAGDKIVGIDVATSINTERDFGQKKILGKTKAMQDSLERTFRVIFRTQQHFDENDKRLEIYRPDLSSVKTIDIFKLKDIEKIGEECVG